MPSKKTITYALAGFLAGLAILTRFLPHPPNFVPIAALALFGACFLPRKWSLILPLSAMLVSDLFIGFYTLPIMLAVYGSFLLIGLLGWLLKKHQQWYFIGSSAILSALIFFFVTNLAVWAFTPLYVKTLSGLLQCFTMALPFFKNTLLGNLFYTASLFGLYQLANIWVKQWLTQKEELCKSVVSKN